VSVSEVLAYEESISCAWALSLEPCGVGMALPSYSPYLAVNTCIVVMQSVAVPNNVQWVHQSCQAAGM
jgi:hypothetical protein